MNASLDSVDRIELVMLIRKAKSKQLKEVAAFVAKLQKENEHHIVYFDHILYFDSTEASKIKKYLQGFEPAWHDCFLLAYENDRLIGVIGAEFDVELGGAWLHGPMVESVSWQAIADELYEAAQEQVIPSGISGFELAGDVTELQAGSPAPLVRGGMPYLRNALFSMGCPEAF